jgi:hypothetical protein
MPPPAADDGPPSGYTARGGIEVRPACTPDAASLAKQLEPNDLALFARIVSAGRFSRASEQLGLPRSTISRRLAVLERTLKQQSLVRSTRRIGLTVGQFQPCQAVASSQGRLSGYLLARRRTMSTCEGLLPAMT